MDSYKEYEWKNEKAKSHDYILPKLLKLLDKNKNSCILDVGCGNGYTALYLISQGFKVYGIDASISGIENAKHTHPNNFFVQNIQTGELPKELQSIKFDTIISTEVIEHLYDPRQYVDFCRTVLGGHGELIISTPYHGYFKNLALAITAKFDNHFTALWDGGHIKFWSIKSLTLLLKEYNFTVNSITGCGRFPYLWKSFIVRAII